MQVMYVAIRCLSFSDSSNVCTTPMDASTTTDEVKGGREKLPEGYHGVARDKRPINDTPLAAVLREKDISYWQAEMVTGISAQMIGSYARNQAIPGYFHAMRMQQHLGVPVESWLGTVLGKLMWEAGKPDEKAIKAKRQGWWKNWARKSGHYDKRYARRKLEQQADSEWLKGNQPEQQVPLAKSEEVEDFVKASPLTE